MIRKILAVTICVFVFGCASDEIAPDPVQEVKMLSPEESQCLPEEVPVEVLECVLPKKLECSMEDNE